MTVPTVSSAYASAVAGATSTGQASGSSPVDPSQFMQLLLAQMQHQNPMEPMKDTEMMSQMVQLNTLQELQMIKMSMEEMASANQTSYAASLVGKVVTAESSGEKIQGKVTGITVEGSNISVHIGEKTVPLNSIKEITEEKAEENANG